MQNGGMGGTGVVVVVVVLVLVLVLVPVPSAVTVLGGRVSPVGATSTAPSGEKAGRRKNDSTVPSAKRLRPSPCNILASWCPEPHSLTWLVLGTRVTAWSLRERSADSVQTNLSSGSHATPWIPCQGRMVRVRVRVRVRVGVRVRVRVGVRGEWKLCLRNVVWYGRAHARARCGVAWRGVFGVVWHGCVCACAEGLGPEL